MIINALVLGAILEADLGPHRKSSWFRPARPLVLAAVLVPEYFKGLTTQGTDVILELAAAIASLLLGLVLTAAMARPPRESRSGGHGAVGLHARWLFPEIRSRALAYSALVVNLPSA